MKYRSLHPDQVKQKLSWQGGCCAICRKPLTYKETCVDHDHQTGELRDILCRHCNWLLGHARESIETLQSAIRYLEKHNVGPVVWPEYHRKPRLTELRLSFMEQAKPVMDRPVKPKPYRQLTLGERVERMIKRSPGMGYQEGKGLLVDRPTWEQMTREVSTRTQAAA